jgi:ribose transport system permease protein
MSVDVNPSMRPRLATRTHQSAGAVRDYGILMAIVALAVALSFASSAFLSYANLLNLAYQWAPVCLMALGGTFVLISGGFDLSIGGIFAVSGVVAVLVTNAIGVEIGLLAGILAGAGLGLFNGLLVAVLRMNVFVATIGSSIVFTGLAAQLTNGGVLITTASGFGIIGGDEVLGVQLPIWIMLVAIVACAVLLNRMAIGRYVRAIGGNIEAARLSGVRTEAVRTFAYVLSGLGGGLAGVIVVSISSSANSASFSAAQFNVWTALLLGGNAVTGGEGAIWRTVAGVVLLALIGNGFILLDIDPLLQQVITGGILLSAVAFDMRIRSARRH